VNITALVPINDFSLAKSRLAGVLPSAERSAFARQSARHVLTVLRNCPGVTDVRVLTPSLEVAIFASEQGAWVVLDPPERRPLGTLVNAALPRGRDADPTLVIMSDLPLVTGPDIEDMIGRLRHADMVIAPDRHDRGTNAVLVRRPQRFVSSFGNVDSFVRHVAGATSVGWRVDVCHRRGLAVDIDVPDDLHLMSAPPPRVATVNPVTIAEIETPARV
jgi:2-phospho-L-lactate guanylyltransferase